MAMHTTVQALAPTPWASLACFLGAMVVVPAARWALRQASSKPGSRWLSLAIPPCYLLLWVAYWLPATQASLSVKAAMLRSPGLGGLPAALLGWHTLRRLAFVVLSFEHWLLRSKLEVLPNAGASLAACQQYRRAMLQRAADFGLWPLLACQAVACASPAVHQAGSL